MRPFNQLTKPERVQAVLAAVEEPVSRTLTFELAGVESRSLNRQERTDVNTVFGNFLVQVPEGKRGHALYQVPLEARQGIIDRLDVDIKSVHGHMADVLSEVWQEMQLSNGGPERRV